MYMIEFDPNKAAINLQKHGIAFADAEPVLYDENALTVELEQNGEMRSHTIGSDALGRLLFVVWVWGDDAPRLISARRANKKEREAYHGN